MATFTGTASADVLGGIDAQVVTLIGGAGDDLLTGNLSWLWRVSSTSLRLAGNGRSDWVSLSADGRYVTFASTASNLVGGDTNGSCDVFRRDIQTGTVTRLSTDVSGAQAAGASYNTSTSSDGRFVAFWSDSANLVPGDSNAAGDIFVKDTETGSITRANTGSSGAESNGDSQFPVLSGDGRFVSFHSSASNLVAGDTNDATDVFVKDLHTGVLTRVSTNAASTQGNGDSSQASISATGRYVAFSSSAGNLVAGDTNFSLDIFRKDTATGTIVRASTDSAGVQANASSFVPALSADGRYIAFYSSASNLVSGDTNGALDVFLKDLQTGATTRLSTDAAGGQANGDSYIVRLSADGRFAVFQSAASNLVAGDTNGVQDVFVKDTQTGAIARVSSDAAGREANGFSGFAAISADGRFVVFTSAATNLASGDSNGNMDVFRVLNPLAVGDTLQGGPGNDTYVISVVNDRVVELPGEGTDTVRSSISYSLPGNVENLSLTGAAAIDATGNSLDNVLAGNLGRNVLSGGAGNDTLSGGPPIARISVSAAGAQASGQSYASSLSADGRYAALWSDAGNLVAGDTNGRLGHGRPNAGGGSRGSPT